MTGSVTRVLLVEDERTESGSSRRMLLQSLGTQLHLSSIRGLTKTCERLVDEEIDAVLLDADVIANSGPSVLSHLRTAAPHLAVLVLGDLHHADMATRCLLAGGQDFLVAEKLTPELLESSLRHAIARQHCATAFEPASSHDELTGLPKRAAFLDAVGGKLTAAQSNAQNEFAVAVLGLDRFNLINDSFGHDFGDQVLVAMTRRLERYAQPTGLIARISGDEFAVLLDAGEGPSEVAATVRSLQSDIRSPIRFGGHEVFTTASAGVCFGGARSASAEEILRNASIALHQAKGHDKGRMEVYRPEMHSRVVEKFHLEMELRRAVEAEEFCLDYQPIVSLESCELIGFEALLRWNHPRRDRLPPSEFIPLAEETGLIIPMERWVLRQTCEQIRQWRKMLPPEHPLSVSVNLSGKHLSQPDLVSEISGLLSDNDLDPRFFKIEITESAVVENSRQAVRLLSALRELGTPLAIDDFGTGYSSLGVLQQFPIDTLKIDRTFVMKLGETRRNSELIRTILQLCNCFELTAVAEGIETDDQLRILRTLGCAFGQGYYFSKPVSARAAEALVLTSAQGTKLPIAASREPGRVAKREAA